MSLEVTRVPTEAIVKLRDLYRHEMACQIIHDSWPERGWIDAFLLHRDGSVVGYATVGGVRGEHKDTITECYVLPPHRGIALALCRRLIEVSGATRVEAQTNDRLLTLLLWDCCAEIERGPVLFSDQLTTALPNPGCIVRRTEDAEKGTIFPHSSEPVGDWLVEVRGEIVATGGLLFHYNVPFGDLYMEVAAPHRRRGFGSYLIQELKRAAYEMGRVPAARCNPINIVSRATLQKAGLFPCARLLIGKIDSCE
jgi:GNAT superfamily N-acetyltransferase